MRHSSPGRVDRSSGRDFMMLVALLSFQVWLMRHPTLSVPLPSLTTASSLPLHGHGDSKVGGCWNGLSQNEPQSKQANGAGGPMDPTLSTREGPSSTGLKELHLASRGAQLPTQAVCTPSICDCFIHTNHLYILDLIQFRHRQGSDH